MAMAIRMVPALHRYSGERRNDCYVIPGLTRNPEGAFDGRLDSGFRRNDGSSNDVPVQIPPRRVCRLNQVQLPLPTPTLERLLTRNGRFHRLVCLVPDQHMNPIFLREPIDKVALVLPDALHKIRRHADIQRAISLAGEDIDAGLLHGPSVLDSGVATPRSGVQGMQSRRNDCSVIPGLTRNPGVAFEYRLDSGIRRNDGRGGVRRNDCSVIPGLTPDQVRGGLRNPGVAFDHRLDSGVRRNDARKGHP